MSVSASAPIHTLLQYQGYSQYSSYSVCPTASHLPRARPQPSMYVLHAVPCHLKRTPHFHATQVQGFPASRTYNYFTFITPLPTREDLPAEAAHALFEARTGFARPLPGPLLFSQPTTHFTRPTAHPARPTQYSVLSPHTDRHSHSITHKQSAGNGVLYRAHTRQQAPARRRSAGAQAK